MAGPYCKETETQFQRWKQKIYLEKIGSTTSYGTIKGNIMSIEATAFISPKLCQYFQDTNKQTL